MDHARAGEGLAATPLRELLDPLMLMAGRAGMAPEFAADGGVLPLELSGDGADRGCLLG